MKPTENVWRQMATTHDAEELREKMEPYMGMMLQRAVDGGPGRLTERMRAVAGAGVAPRLASALCARLVKSTAPLVSRDTVLLAETLG
jgi:hypothetical protein